MSRPSVYIWATVFNHFFFNIDVLKCLDLNEDKMITVAIFFFCFSPFLQKRALFSIWPQTYKADGTLWCWGLETITEWSRTAPSRLQCATAVAKTSSVKTPEVLLLLEPLSSWEYWGAFCCCSVSLRFTLFKSLKSLTRFPGSVDVNCNFKA